MSDIDDFAAEFLTWKLFARKAMVRAAIAERALRKIGACDYRGNRPPEQQIALEALAELAALSATPAEAGSQPSTGSGDTQ